MTVLTGESGARYRLEGAPLAVGGQALVYRARAEDDDRAVALKVSQNPISVDESFKAQLDLVARISAHPTVGRYVAPVWDHGRWDDRTFAVLDWYDETLATWCRDRGPAERLAAARALVTCVQALGDAGIVHGDVKPHNVLVHDGDADALLLTDFGVAAVGVKGLPFTPGYAPPEQIAGEDPTPGWDRFALAATLWDCLTGVPAEGPRLETRPTAGDRAAFAAAFPRHAGLRRALEAHLAPRPRDRPRDLAALARALAGETLAIRPGTWRWLAAAVPVAVAGGALFHCARAPACPPGFAAEAGACVADDGRRVVRVGPSGFLLGRLDDERPDWTADAPPHPVALTRALWVSDVEVTQAEWTRVMGSDPVGERVQRFASGIEAPCRDWLGQTLVDPNHPAVCVSWYDAIAYANARSRRDGLQPAYGDGAVDGRRQVTWDRDANGWRLPTEAEWEWFARGGTRSPWGAAPARDAVCGWANVRDADAAEKWGNEVACRDGHAALAPVRTFRPNGYGLHDTLGNALEWVWDVYGPYPSGLVVDPTGARAGTSRGLRGGSWNHVARGVDGRYAEPPDAFAHTIGFRVVRTVP